jgi:hypothetical protein
LLSGIPVRQELKRQAVNVCAADCPSKLHAEQIPLAVVPIIAIGADQGDQTCHETFQDK